MLPLSQPLAPSQSRGSPDDTSLWRRTMRWSSRGFVQQCKEEDEQEEDDQRQSWQCWQPGSGGSLKCGWVTEPVLSLLILPMSRCRGGTLHLCVVHPWWWWTALWRSVWMCQRTLHPPESWSNNIVTNSELLHLKNINTLNWRNVFCQSFSTFLTRGTGGFIFGRSTGCHRWWWASGVDSAGSACRCEPALAAPLTSSNGRILELPALGEMMMAILLLWSPACICMGGTVTEAEAASMPMLLILPPSMFKGKLLINSQLLANQLWWIKMDELMLSFWVSWSCCRQRNVFVWILDEMSMACCMRDAVYIGLWNSARFTHAQKKDLNLWNQWTLKILQRRRLWPPKHLLNQSIHGFRKSGNGIGMPRGRRAMWLVKYIIN